MVQKDRNLTTSSVEKYFQLYNTKILAELRLIVLVRRAQKTNIYFIHLKPVYANDIEYLIYQL